MSEPRVNEDQFSVGEHFRYTYMAQGTVRLIDTDLAERHQDPCLVCGARAAVVAIRMHNGLGHPDDPRWPEERSLSLALGDEWEGEE